jgi:hypothetical protein
MYKKEFESDEETRAVVDGEIALESGQTYEGLNEFSDSDRSSDSVNSVELVDLLHDRLNGSKSQDPALPLGKSARVAIEEPFEKPRHEHFGKAVEDRFVMPYPSSPMALSRNQSLLPDTSKIYTSTGNPAFLHAESIEYIPRHYKDKGNFPQSKLAISSNCIKPELRWSTFEDKIKYPSIVRSPSSSNAPTPDRFYSQIETGTSTGKEVQLRDCSEILMRQSSGKPKSDSQGLDWPDKVGSIRERTEEIPSLLNKKTIQEHMYVSKSHRSIQGAARRILPSTWYSRYMTPPRIVASRITTNFKTWELGVRKVFEVRD